MNTGKIRIIIIIYLDFFLDDQPILLRFSS